MNLLINSFVDFYHVIKNRPHIVDLSPELVKFRDFSQLYVEGCNCNKEEYKKKIIDIYSKFDRIDNTPFLELKNIFKVDKIIFNSNGVYLFKI